MVQGPTAVDLPFIGRVDELARLRRHLDRALEGQPSLILLSGDAGVGKSRLLTEAMAGASDSGFEVLFGSCHEDLGIPYLPIATALRRLQHDGAARLDPRRARAAVTAADPEEAAASRLDLYLDVTGAIVDTAADRPTMLVLDDLHWADDASAELIRHLVLSALHEAAALQLPLVLVLAARGPWPEGVPGALARLPREGGAGELRLDPFGVVEVHAMTTAIAGARPRTEVINALLEATSGNVLLLRGVITRNLETGSLVVRGGDLELTSAAKLAAPTDLDAEVRHELSHVSPSGHRVLEVASVLGDAGAIDLLRSLCGDELAPAVVEVFAARSLRADGRRYRFSHPQVRHVVYDDLADGRRQALHLEVAATLEQLDDSSGANALAIAHHLRRGGADHGDARVARWARLAGDQAWASGALEEAFLAYALALEGAARVGLPHDEATELLLRTGIAAYYANDDACLRWLSEAAAAADALGDHERRTRAILIAARFRLIATAATLGEAAPVDELERLLPDLADRPDLRALVLATIADLHVVGLDQAAAEAAADDAEAALQEAGAGSEATAQVTFTLGVQALSALRFDEARRHFGTVARIGDVHRALAAESRLGLADLAQGRLDAAVDHLEHARSGERRLSSHAGQQLPTAALAAIRMLHGGFAEIEHLAAEVQALYEIQEYAFTPGLVFPTLAAARLLRGDATGARDALDRWDAAGGRGTWRYRALVDALTGDTDRLAAGLAERRWPAIRATNLFTLDTPCLHVHVGAAVQDADLVRSGLPHLVAAHEKGMRVTLGWPWLVSRVLGDGHAALGELAAADRWYRRAREESDRSGTVLEQGFISLGEAGVMLARGNQARAATLATRAAADLDGLHALLPARDARAVVDDAGGVMEDPRQRFILFTDMVGSTELNVRAGDGGFVGLADEHFRILRSRLRRHDGVEFGHRGDGLAIWFAHGPSALDCAFGILEDLERASLSHPELPVRVRLGIAVGRPQAKGDELFGIKVVEASRICDLAKADQILVSDEVRAAAGEGFGFDPVGEHHLKGMPAPQPLFQALPIHRR